MRRLVLIAALLTVLSAPGWADFDAGRVAYERGDYTTAFREFLSSAKQGDADAQFGLGIMYEFGEGVSQDYGEAARW